MKKAAIITITHGENYGNRLQNYATTKLLEDLGFCVETINHHHGVSYKKYILINIKNSVKKVIKRNNIFIKKEMRKSAFEKFNNKYIKFSKYQTWSNYIPKKLKDEYDFFICGSDQIWNPYHPESVNVYFLTFADYEKSIAFAPSLAVSNIPEEMKETYKNMLNGIKNISVREEIGAELLRSLTDKEVTVLCDPTLALTKEEWLNISIKPRISIENKFILTYFLGEKTKETINNIKKIAKENNLEIIDLLDIKNSDIYSIDPSEFIYLINKCELMCTDSFHGAVFSLIMQTPFIVYERRENESKKSMNSRLETLLNLFNMNKRKIDYIKTNDDVFNIDFTYSQKVMSNQRQRSIAYLKNALKE